MNHYGKQIYKIIAICGMVFILFLGDSRQTDTNSAENGMDNSVMSEYVADVCDAVKNMDFTIREPRLDITSEEDRLYKKAYLKVLKNEMPILEWEKQYYKDLRGAGIPFEDLLERKDDDSFPYLLYYDDLDGDGKPELGINQGCLYLFDYEMGDEGVHVLYCQESCYLGNILGSGQIWYHDGLHADVIRDRYIFLNQDNEWEEGALDLEQGINPSYKYYLVGTTRYEQTDVGEKNWNEITKPFFEATEHEISPKTFAEILYAQPHAEEVCR